MKKTKRTHALDFKVGFFKRAQPCFQWF